MDQASGRFAGSDAYDQVTYNQYGVTHQHNILKKDQYWINGQESNQSDAEEWVRLNKKYGGLRK